jgi:putative copper export protein
MSAIAPIERRVARMGMVIAFVLIGAWMLKMVVQVMGFRDPFVPLWDDVSFLLFETFWGTVWMAQGILLPLLAVAFWRARGISKGGWMAAAAIALGLVATLALSGHAMGVDAWRPLIVSADGVHTLAAGSWIGTLAIILSVGRPEDGVTADPALYAAQIRSFSAMAIVSVAALVSMGVVLAWTHLGAISDLWTLRYGRVLTAKIALAGVCFGAGFVNWRKGLPALDTASGARVVQRRAAWEVSMAVGVLLVTAVLVHSPKP